MRFATLGLAITLALGILVLILIHIQSTNYVTAQGGNRNVTGGGNGNVTGATFLFIQGAQSGSISEVNATTSTLELSDVSDKTILFSDRPDRIVSSIDTTNFIGNWSTGPNSFAVDPPNIALIVDDVDAAEQRQDLAVIELFNPEYDSEANTLRYDIVAENGTSIGGLPGEFGQSTLVIDDDGHPHVTLSKPTTDYPGM